MAIKKIISLLLVAAMLFSLGICAYADDVAADDYLETNNGIVNDNNGTVNVKIGRNNNNGFVGTNDSVVDNNYGTVVSNDGVVDNNYGTIFDNRGLVTTNAENGLIERNSLIVKTNSGTISDSYGTVTTNAENGRIETNIGTITDNNGTITDNIGIVIDNNGTINKSDGTVDTNSENGTVSQNYGIVTDNYGTVANTTDGIHTGRVSNNYGIVYEIDGNRYYGVTYTDEEGSIISNTSVAEGSEITVDTPDEGYKWVENNSKEEYTEETNIVVKAVKWFIKTLITPTIETPPPTKPTTPPAEPTTPPAKPEKSSDNSESTYVVQLRAITYIKGSGKDLATGVKAGSEDVKVEVDNTVITDFEVVDGEVVISAEYLDTLNAGNHLLCITVRGAQTWLSLIVR